MKNKNKIWLLFFCFITSIANSQPLPLNLDCPPNIGFESGTFNNWNCFAGTILRDGSLNLSASSPVPDRHTIIANSYPQELDPYGKFPINCPNGSGYSIRLGNAISGGQAEGVSYTFNIPAGNNDYSILYNYAVVFQNPPHKPYEQPRFTSKVYNVTDNKYIDCGSFEFVASSTLPGFQLSSLGNAVYYKPWSPVTVNLSNLAGKTVRLEFTTNDCAFTQHFGYAYLDVNEDCSSSPISGNTYCGEAQSVTLIAPFGFATYTWFLKSDFSQSLGSENILTISPSPPPNTDYAVAVTPYDGLGCIDTLYTTINVSNDLFKLNVVSNITGCSTGVDLTSPAVTEGSTSGLNYSYFTDLNQTNYVPVPSRVTTSGTYYIKGVNRAGCNDLKPITVTIVEPPRLVINNPTGVCKPQTVDITAPAITAESDAGLELKYWKNFTATIPLTNPNAIDKSGTYYITGVLNGSCAAVKAVDVKIGAIPNIVINNPTGCGKVNLTDANVISGGSPDISYTYFMDAAATVSIADPINITVTGTYYIIASSTSGCSIIRPVFVTVNPLPVFTVTNPAPVVYPVITIDLTTAVNQNLGLAYSYWLDSLTRKPVINPRAVDKRGRYFIRATNEFGCTLIEPVNAVIVPPPEPIVYVPTGFTPNNDGINDLFKIKVVGEVSINHFRIYSRWGQLIYDDPNTSHYWNGKLRSAELPAGVYIWILDGLDTYFKKPFSHKGLITLIK
jgi:gliding motility-associated-like protein